MFGGTRVARVAAARARRPAKRLFRAAPARGADRFGISRAFLALLALARHARARDRSLLIHARSAEARDGWCASAWLKRKFRPALKMARGFASLGTERRALSADLPAICMSCCTLKSIRSLSARGTTCSAL